MNPTIVRACVQDQHLQLVAEPFIASGGVNIVQIQFEFCGLWTGCGKTAVFYRDPAKTYLVPLEGDRATVPHEVMADEGFFYFGVMGSASNVRTTEVIKVKVARGAIVAEPAEPEAPTVYQQMISRWTEAIAMRAPGGGVVLEYDDPEGSNPRVVGNIRSSGAKVFVNLEFYAPGIDPGETFEWNLPEGMAPWGDEADLECYTEALMGDPSALEWGSHLSDLLVAGAYGYLGGPSHPCIGITNTGDFRIGGGYGGVDRIRVQGQFDLSSVSIAELADARVGADGTTYPTAGDAVRAIEGKIPSSVRREDDQEYTTITDQHIEIAAGENDDSMIEMSEAGIDIHANGGVSISNVVDPTQDDDAVNKKYVDNAVRNLQPGGGGGADLSEYVKKTDYATKDTAGVVTLDPAGSFGVGWNEQAGLFVSGAGKSEIQKKNTANKPITPYHLDYAIRVGITDNTETLTGEEQAKAQEWLGVTAIVGDIEVALDGIIAEQEAIIAIQNKLIGGDAS